MRLSRNIMFSTVSTGFLYLIFWLVVLPMFINVHIRFFASKNSYFMAKSNGKFALFSFLH